MSTPNPAIIPNQIRASHTRDGILSSRALHVARVCHLNRDLTTAGAVDISQPPCYISAREAECAMLFRVHRHAPASVLWFPRRERRRS